MQWQPSQVDEIDEQPSLIAPGSANRGVYCTQYLAQLASAERLEVGVQLPGAEQFNKAGELKKKSQSYEVSKTAVQRLVTLYFVD